MELQVDICKLELQGSQNVNVKCTADNGFEVCESASAASATANSPQGSKTRPKFAFRFAAPSGPHVIVSFSVRDAANGTEVAKCAVLVPLQMGSDLVRALSDKDSQGCSTAILTTPIAGTDAAKFAGKVHFAIQHTYIVPPRPEVVALPWPTARHELGRDPSAHIDDLVTRETAALANSTAVPDDDAIVTILFHSLNLESAPDIKPIAYPGRESDDHEQGVMRVFQDKVGRVQSILVQKKLRCNDAESIEICITNHKTGHMIFRMLLPLASLQPFIYKHWCQPFTAGSNSASFATLVERRSPGMVVTAALAAPKSSYHQYEGLELCICSVDPGFSTDYSKIVVCAQIINKNSKSRLREPNFHDPPFEEGNKQAKKIATESNRQDPLVYKMAVVNIAPCCEEVYFFFPADREIHTSGNFALQLAVYPVRPVSSGSWWETAQVGSVGLEITSVLGFLMQADCHDGARWDVAIEPPVGSMSSREQNRVLSPAESEGTITAVLRWKTRQVPFLSLPTALELQTLPDLNSHMSAGSPVMWTTVTVPVEPTSRDTNPVRNEADLLFAQHKTAISLMGQDILHLRQQNASLAAQNQQLQSQVRSICGSESRANAELEAMGKHELVQTILLLQNELQAEKATRKENQNRAQGLQSLLARQSDCEAQYAQLLEVHAVQQRLVQKLQSKVQKLQRCYEVCKQQQTIVNQLEALLAHQITTQDMSLMEVTARLQRDNAELKQSLQSYQDEDDTQQRLVDLQQRRVETELSQALARCKQLEALLEQKRERAPEGRHDLELQQRLLLAETQVGTLLTELKESARKWATASDVIQTTCTNSSGKVISF